MSPSSSFKGALRRTTGNVPLETQQPGPLHPPPPPFYNPIRLLALADLLPEGSNHSGSTQQSEEEEEEEEEEEYIPYQFPLPPDEDEPFQEKE